MCPQASSLVSLVCRCATAARDREKSSPALTVCLQSGLLWTARTCSLWRSAGGGFMRGLNMKPSLVASNTPSLVTGCCTQTHTTVLTICTGFHFESQRDTYFSKHSFLKHCLMGRKIEQSQARNLFTEQEAQSFKVSPPP